MNIARVNKSNQFGIDGIQFNDADLLGDTKNWKGPSTIERFSRD